MLKKSGKRGFFLGSQEAEANWKEANHFLKCFLDEINVTPSNESTPWLQGSYINDEDGVIIINDAHSESGIIVNNKRHILDLCENFTEKQIPKQLTRSAQPRLTVNTLRNERLHAQLQNELAHTKKRLEESINEIASNHSQPELVVHQIMHNHNQPMCINKYPQGTFTSLVVDNCKLKSPQNRPMISVAKVRENVLEAKKANSMQTTQNLSTCSVQDKTWHIPEKLQLPELSQPLVMDNNSLIGKNTCKVKRHSFTIETLINHQFTNQAFGADQNPRIRNSLEIHRFNDSSTPKGWEKDNWCSVCLGCDNSLIFCNNCPKGFHRGCHIPAVEYPPPSRWICLLCEEIPPLPLATYHFFRPEEKRIANRLLLELFCQVEASWPFRNQCMYGQGQTVSSLLQIKSHLVNGRYISFLKFIADIRSMLVNCFRFRQAEPTVIAHAKSLEEIFNRLLAKFIPHLNSSANPNNLHMNMDMHVGLYERPNRMHR